MRKPRYTLSHRRDISVWLVYRDAENVACATTEREARDLIRFLRDEEAH